ncbi:MAG: DUF4149 domain-containing protein [Bacteroidota bacterium]|nr:DUF4149 domain-containing protein [Bacteroidota bacterium]
MDTISLSVLLKWIHLMATVAWIGGMFTNLFINIPAIVKTLDGPVAGNLMGAIMKRFRVLVYVSMAVFLITGITMGSLHLNAGEVFSSKNQMVAILILKVPLYIIMVVLAIVAFEFVAPRVARLAAEGPSPKLQRAQRTQKVLAMAGFLLGVLILALSAAL